MIFLLNFSVTRLHLHNNAILKSAGRAVKNRLNLHWLLPLLDLVRFASSTHFFNY